MRLLRNLDFHTQMCILIENMEDFLEFEQVMAARTMPGWE